MIKVEHLTKYYGDHLAVDDLSFEIPEGHVYGFLGPNGAGKTTTMNIMTGCLSATSGRVEVDGCDIFEDALQAKKRIGYLPEQPPLYLSETPEEYLRFVGEAKGLRGTELHEQIEQVIRQVKLEGMRGRRIAALSKGYKQRVGIAQALLGSPKVIILDEPTVGLDPIQIIEIRDLIRELGKEHTVILSSHILSEVRAVCQRIMIISRGRLVASDTPDNLEKLFAGTATLELTVKGSQEQARAVLGALPGVSSLTCRPGEEEGRTAVSLETDPPADLSEAAFHACATHDLPILRMDMRRASLEDVFLELTAADQPELSSQEEEPLDEPEDEEDEES